MDYGKTGKPKSARNTPRTPDFGQKAGPVSVTPPRENKAVLLARMKAAAEAARRTKG